VSIRSGNTRRSRLHKLIIANGRCAGIVDFHASCALTSSPRDSVAARDTIRLSRPRAIVDHARASSPVTYTLYCIHHPRTDLHRVTAATSFPVPRARQTIIANRAASHSNRPGLPSVTPDRHPATVTVLVCSDSDARRLGTPSSLRS
jgi:hypothetical protein